MKKFLAIAMAAVLSLSLAACGGASSSTASSAAASSSEAASTGASSEAASASTAAYDYSSYTGETIEAIKAKGKLVVGTEAQYAPFEFKDMNANFVGCDIWLAQQVADALGVELEVMDMAFDGIIPAVKSNQVDIGIAAFTVDEERAKEIDFTDMYQKDEQMLIVKKGNEEVYTTKESLAGQQVGAQRGTTQSKLIQSALPDSKKDEQMLIVKKGNEEVYTTKESLAGQQVGAQRGTTQSKLIQSALPDSKLFELDKWPALAMEVANGNIAAIVVDGAVGEGLVANNPGIAQANFTFSQEEANFGKAAVLAKGKEDLKELVNAVIANVTADGSFQAAYDEAVELSQSMGI